MQTLPFPWCSIPDSIQTVHSWLICLLQTLDSIHSCVACMNPQIPFFWRKFPELRCHLKPNQSTCLKQPLVSSSCPWQLFPPFRASLKQRAIDGVIQKPIAQQAGSREKLEIPKMGKSIRCVFGFFSVALNQQKYNIHIPKARWAHWLNDCSTSVLLSSCAAQAVHQYSGTSIGVLLEEFMSSCLFLQRLILFTCLITSNTWYCKWILFEVLLEKSPGTPANNFPDFFHSECA